MRTNEMVLVFGGVARSAIIQLAVAVGAFEKPRKQADFACSERSALVFANFLHTLPNGFLYNRLMGVLENLPFHRVFMKCFLVLEGFSIRTKIDSMSDILQPFQDVRHYAP
jgi:hypothetical protein